MDGTTLWPSIQKPPRLQRDLLHRGIVRPLRVIYPGLPFPQSRSVKVRMIYCSGTEHSRNVAALESRNSELHDAPASRTVGHSPFDAQTGDQVSHVRRGA